MELTNLGVLYGGNEKRTPHCYYLIFDASRTYRSIGGVRYLKSLILAHLLYQARNPKQEHETQFSRRVQC